MPFEVRLFVRTSLFSLVLAAILGVAMVAGKHVLGWTVPWALVVVHTHVALVGGVLLMIVGVAFWMFPLQQGRFPESRGRYRPAVARAVYGLLAGGLALRAVVEPFQGSAVGGTGGILLALSAAAQAAGLLLFVTHVWSRVRSVTTP